MKKSVIFRNSTISRNAMQILIRQHTLCQWTKCDNSNARIFAKRFYTIFFYAPVKHRISSLIHYKRAM